MNGGHPISVHVKRSLAGFTLDAAFTAPGRGVTALFGPSGAGKTSILRAIAGLDHDISGSVHVGGAAWLDTATRTCLPPHRRPVGFVFQDAHLFAHIDVRGNLEFGARRARGSATAGSFKEVVALLGLGHLLDRRPEMLSGGERRRVAIGRALLVAPAVLLMDEPLVGLDGARKQEIMPWLERLHRETELPILYVSHDIDEVARLADHLVVLDNGNVTTSGQLAEVLARLDPPLHRGPDSGVVLETVIAGRDAAWHLCRAEFEGGSLWLPDHGRSAGSRVRVLVKARDVSLTLGRSEESSVLNVLPAIVEGIADGAHPALALVRVRVGASPLLAQVTRRSAATLGLVPGTAVWAQVKSAALLD